MLAAEEECLHIINMIISRYFVFGLVQSKLIIEMDGFRQLLISLFRCEEDATLSTV